MRGAIIYGSRKNRKIYCRIKKGKNLTQEQLGEKLGVTHKSISKWENGKCLPDPSFI